MDKHELIHELQVIDQMSNSFAVEREIRYLLDAISKNELNVFDDGEWACGNAEIPIALRQREMVNPSDVMSQIKDPRSTRGFPA